MNIRWQTNSPRDIWTITRKHQKGWLDWVVPLQAYKLSSCFSPLPCFSFLPKQNAPLSKFWQRIPNFLVVSQQTSHWSLHAIRVPLPCSIIPLECSVEQVLTADLSACTVGASRLLIMMSMNNLKSPTKARITQPGYNYIELHTTGCGAWAGNRLNKSHWPI